MLMAVENASVTCEAVSENAPTPQPPIFVFLAHDSRYSNYAMMYHFIHIFKQRVLTLEK